MMEEVLETGGESLYSESVTPMDDTSGKGALTKPLCSPVCMERYWSLSAAAVRGSGVPGLLLVRVLLLRDGRVSGSFAEGRTFTK